jgi:hypothetical protein
MNIMLSEKLEDKWADWSITFEKTSLLLFPSETM